MITYLQIYWIMNQAKTKGRKLITYALSQNLCKVANKGSVQSKTHRKVVLLCGTGELVIEEDTRFVLSW